MVDSRLVSNIFAAIAILAFFQVVEGCFNSNKNGYISTPPPPAPPPPVLIIESPSVTVKTAAESPTSIPAGSCGLNVYQVPNSVDALRRKRLSSANNRILGGYDADENEIPWQTRVHITPMTGPDAGQTILCGGAIIANQWILTAAHCLLDPQYGLPTAKIWAGGNKISSSVNEATAEVNVIDFNRHPNYNHSSHDYDIALLQLATPLIFSDRIQPVCLPRACSADCQATENAMISGWGTRSNDSTQAQPSLQKATVEIVSKPICQAGFRDHGIRRPLTDRMVCAGDPRTGADSCKGDDGGPMACIPKSDDGAYYLTGIKSVVDRCGAAGFYSVYTRICEKSIINWIDAVTGNILKVTTPRPAGSSNRPKATTPTGGNNIPPNNGDNNAVTVIAATTAATVTVDDEGTIAMDTPPAGWTEYPDDPSTDYPDCPEGEDCGDGETPSQPSQIVSWTNDPVCGIRNSNARKSRATTSPNRSTYRIVGGVDAIQNEFPWQVRIETNGFLCGGSLISKDWIVTAAHCIDPDDIEGQPSTVYLGSQFVSSGLDEEIVQDASFRIQHQQYDKNLHYNDIALIKLSESVEFTDNIRPICLLDSDCKGEPAPGSTCVISGWGTIKEDDGNPSEVLQKANVPFIARDVCQKAYKAQKYPDIITDGMNCAGYEAGGIDTCQGDSGGPLACADQQNKYYLNGATSYGYGCAKAGLYGIYSRPCHYMDWIIKTINDQTGTRRGRHTTARNSNRKTVHARKTTIASRIGGGKGIAGSATTVKRQGQRVVTTTRKTTASRKKLTTTTMVNRAGIFDAGTTKRLSRTRTTTKRPRTTKTTTPY